MNYLIVFLFIDIFNSYAKTNIRMYVYCSVHTVLSMVIRVAKPPPPVASPMKIPLEATSIESLLTMVA